MVGATLICHDVFFEERAEEYYLNDDQVAGNGAAVLQKVLLTAELTLLVFFIIDMILHMVAYGNLFVKRIAAVLEFLLILANIATLVTMIFDFKRSKDLFRVSILLAIPFLYFRICTIMRKIENGQKSIS